jgi:Cu(I)/Ag(I) efflux system membrane fusion protein
MNRRNRMLMDIVSIVSNRALVAAAMLGIVVAGCTHDPVSSTAASSAATPASQGATVRAKAAIYKCPMHPNVTSNKPGKCPECGMNLEKVQ